MLQTVRNDFMRLRIYPRNCNATDSDFARGETRAAVGIESNACFGTFPCREEDKLAEHKASSFLHK